MSAMLGAGSIRAAAITSSNDLSRSADRLQDDVSGEATNVSLLNCPSGWRIWRGYQCFTPKLSFRMTGRLQSPHPVHCENKKIVYHSSPKLVNLPSFLTSFLFLLSFLSASTSIQGILWASASSQCSWSPRMHTFMEGRGMWRSLSEAHPSPHPPALPHLCAAQTQLMALISTL